MMRPRALFLLSGPEMMTTRAHKLPPEINMPGLFHPHPQPGCMWASCQGPQQSSGHLPRAAKIVIIYPPPPPWQPTSVEYFTADRGIRWPRFVCCDVETEARRGQSGVRARNRVEPDLLTHFYCLCSLPLGQLILCVGLTDHGAQSLVRTLFWVFL